MEGVKTPEGARVNYSPSPRSKKCVYGDASGDGATRRLTSSTPGLGAKSHLYSFGVLPNLRTNSFLSVATLLKLHRFATTESAEPGSCSSVLAPSARIFRTHEAGV